MVQSRLAFPLRCYLCLLVFILPLKFGSFVGNGEQPNFPLNGWEWLFFNCYPSYLASFFSGLGLLAAVCIYPLGKSVFFRWSLGVLLLPLLAGGIGLFQSSELDYAFQWIYHYAGVFSLGASLIWAAREDKALLPAIARTIAIVGILSALHGWYQHFYGMKAMREETLAILKQQGSQISEMMMQKLAQTRVYSTFVDPNVYAAHLLFCMPFALVFGYRWGQHFEPARVSSIVLTSVLGLLFIGGIFFSESRGAMLGFCAGVGCLVWLSPKVRHWRWRWVLLLSLCLLAVVLVGVMSLKSSRNGLATASTRLVYYRCAFQMFCQHPWTGCGLGEFFTHYLQLKPAGAEVTRNPHSFVLAFASECGLLGLLAALVWLVIPWIAATLGWEKLPGVLREERWLFRAACIGLAAWTVHSLVQFNDLVPGTAFLAFSSVAFLGGCRCNVSSSKGDCIGLCLLGLLACCSTARISGEMALQMAEKQEKERSGLGEPFLKKAAESLSYSLVPWRMLSERYARDGRFEEEVAAAERMVALAPHRSSVHLREAKAQFCAGERDKALLALENALAWYPYDPDTLAVKALVLMSAGLTPSQISLLRSQLSLDTHIGEADEKRIVVEYGKENKDFAAGLLDKATFNVQDGRRVVFRPM